MQIEDIRVAICDDEEFYKVDGEQVCYEPLKKIYSRLHENTCATFNYN